MSDEAEKESFRCWVYKGARRGETYLYLAEEDGFDAAPRALIEQMGTLELVMELELYPGRELARADSTEVMRSLQSRGYYLQLPPADMPGRHRLQ
ncbi:MAG: YcgL domain-containing protein [Gammaproteobacteria bacterium]|nr:YcgL domain-containing protein [Gammaproteobacteria bacterium]